MTGKKPNPAASADVWQRRHATTGRQLEMTKRLLEDAKREIKRLQEDAVRLNERIVEQNKRIAKLEGGTPIDAFYQGPQ